MLRHEALARHARAFRSLSGFDPDAFEILFADFQAASARLLRNSRKTRRGTPRKRVAGAGHPHSLDPRTRLLLGLVWLRAYPTYTLLSVLFGLDEGNALRNARDVAAVL